MALLLFYFKCNSAGNIHWNTRPAYELDAGSEAAGGAAFDPEAHEAGSAKLPRSFAKIQRMTRSLRANQFVSFAE